MEKILMNLTTGTERVISEADKQIATINAQMNTTQESYRATAQKEQTFCQDKINKLSTYKSDYKNYITSVHTLFEEELTREKSAYIRRMKENYDKLTKAYHTAVANEKNPRSVGTCQSFNFPKSLYNSIVDLPEQSGGLGSLINTLIGVSYTGIFGLTGYTLYRLYTYFRPEAVENASGTDFIPYLMDTPYYQWAIWGLLGITLLTLLLRVGIRASYISNSNSRINIEKGRLMKELHRNVVNAEQDLQGYKNRNPEFFDSLGNFVAPPVESIKFSEQMTFNILSNVQKKVSMKIDTSLFKETYTFRLYTSSFK